LEIQTASKGRFKQNGTNEQRSTYINICALLFSAEAKKKNKTTKQKAELC